MERKNRPEALDRQRRRLAAWLREWKLDEILRSADRSEDVSMPDAGVPPGTPLAQASRPVQPQAGQIRLLYPLRNSPAFLRPIYVAVLQEQIDMRPQAWDERVAAALRRDAGPREPLSSRQRAGQPVLGSRRLLVAPFSRFSAPGLPGEWCTGMRPPPLRVLCLWNSRNMSESALRLSWLAGRLSPSKLAKALELLASDDPAEPGDRRSPSERGSAGAASPAPVPPGTIGPPIRHPLDPRLQYQAEEAQVFEDCLLAAEGASQPSAASNTGAEFRYESSPSQWLMAAESREQYRTMRKPKANRKRRHPS